MINDTSTYDSNNFAPAIKKTPPSPRQDASTKNENEIDLSDELSSDGK
jgi:hypothetical protein